MHRRSVSGTEFDRFRTLTRIADPVPSQCNSTVQLHMAAGALSFKYATYLSREFLDAKIRTWVDFLREEMPKKLADDVGKRGSGWPVNSEVA
jgi:hypothetical protein